MFTQSQYAILTLSAIFVFLVKAREPTPDKNAIVTLVTGVNSGYSAGAIALGQSLIDVGSKLTRVAMVTPEVDYDSRKLMSKLWEVVEVKPVACNHKLHPSITPDKFDLKGANYQAGLKRWSSTCTKFAAWTMTKFERIIFIDSDTLVINKIDDALYGFSNASFLAAPEAFPPDNFNSGFMVLNPSEKGYQNLLSLNEKVGSAEGGDQGVFNNGLCPNWFFAAPDDENCGRLPWIFNVEAANFGEYHTLRQMSGLRLPSVIHFVSDGKPWKVLAMDYASTFAEETKQALFKQALAHLLWRNAYFKATGESQPFRSVFDELTKPQNNKPKPFASTSSTKVSKNELKPSKVRRVVKKGKNKSKRSKADKSGENKTLKKKKKMNRKRQIEL